MDITRSLSSGESPASTLLKLGGYIGTLRGGLGLVGGAGAGLFGRLVSVTSSMEVSKLSESTGGLRAFCGVGRTLTLLQSSNSVVCCVQDSLNQD